MNGFSTTGAQPCPQYWEIPLIGLEIPTSFREAAPIIGVMPSEEVAEGHFRPPPLRPFRPCQLTASNSKAANYLTKKAFPACSSYYLSTTLKFTPPDCIGFYETYAIMVQRGTGLSNLYCPSLRSLMINKLHLRPSIKKFSLQPPKSVRVRAKRPQPSRPICQWLKTNRPTPHGWTSQWTQHWDSGPTFSKFTAFKVAERKVVTKMGVTQPHQRPLRPRRPRVLLFILEPLLWFADTL